MIARTNTAKIGLALLLISAVLPLSMLPMFLWPSPRGNDFGSGATAFLWLCYAFLIVSPASAIYGLILIRRSSENRTLHLASWIITLPTIIGILCISFSIAWNRRAPTIYDSSNYQHLVGRSFREVKSELDTRNASYGSGGGFDTIYLRGMEIHGNREGVITEVRNRRGITKR